MGQKFGEMKKVGTKYYHEAMNVSDWREIGKSCGFCRKDCELQLRVKFQTSMAPAGGDIQQAAGETGQVIKRESRVAYVDLKSICPEMVIKPLGADEVTGREREDGERQEFCLSSEMDIVSTMSPNQSRGDSVIHEGS